MVWRLLFGPGGRFLELFTGRPSLQLYNGCFMGGSDRGYHDTPYFAGAELALEPQDFPDAPHHPHFPSIEITPEHPYRQITEYRFGIRR